MDRSRRIIGAVLILMSLVGLFSWERWGRDRFVYDEILVLEKDAQRGDKITGKMLKILRVENAPGDAARPGQKGKIIGKQAAQFIHGGQALFSEYFREDGTVSTAGSGRFVMKIPEAWIESMPDSLKRGDTARFEAAGVLTAKARVASVGEERRDLEVIVTESQAKALGRAAADGQKFVLSYQS